MSTIYGTDNTGVVATTDTKAAPNVAFDSDLDNKIFNAMSIGHTGTTNGTTINTADWLHFKVTYVGGKVYTGVILPNVVTPVQSGDNSSLITKIELWGTVPNSATAAANNICVTINGMSVR